MWRDYTINYIKKNKSMIIFVMIAVLVASMFISLLSTLFYNMWIDDIERIKATEGDWQARITIKLNQEEIKEINNFENVEEVIISEDSSYINIYFSKISRIYEDMNLISEKLNISKENIEYHSSLLQKQFVYSEEKGEKPTPVEIFYIVIIMMMCISLILMIKNVFSFFMNSRTKELGILQSIGATPKQIKVIMFQEATILSILPIITGNVIGIGLVIAFVKYANILTSQLGRASMEFHYNIIIFFITFIVTIITIFISIWLPAKKISKLEPIQLINKKALKIKKVKKYTILSKIFGVEGEIARKSIYIRRKELRTSTICLTLSFFALSIFLNFMTLSEISTTHTYWNRFQNIWDVMIETNSEKIDNKVLKSIREIEGVSKTILYKTDTYKTIIGEKLMSEELISKGGYEQFNKEAKTNQEGEYIINSSVIILDDESFDSYCQENNIDNIKKDYPVGIIVNKIGGVLYNGCDDTNFIPFIEEDENLSLNLFKNIDDMKNSENIEIIGYSKNVPEIREDFEIYSLLIVIPESSYNNFKYSTSITSFINIKTQEDKNILDIEDNINDILSEKFNYTIENRIESYNTNVQIYEGYKKIITLICTIIACIGISNVFANVFGYMEKRKREFAEYQSIGVTPKGIAKILLAEGIFIGVRPIIISIPFNILFILLTTSNGGITLNEFLKQMPIFKTSIFAIAMIVIIIIMYYITSKKLLKVNIADALKSDEI